MNSQIGSLSNVASLVLLVSTICVFSHVSTALASKRGPRVKKSTEIDVLFNRVLKYQEKEEVPLIPSKQFARKKGLYASGVKLNFHGDPQVAEIRRLASVYDNNMFVTAWVTSQLLEAAQYAEAPKPKESQLHLALQAIGDFHDRNVAYNTSVMTFWPQVYNKTVNYYQSTPQNLLECFRITDELPMDEIEKILEFMGLKELAKEIQSIMKDKNMFLQAFHIPPDFDDTFVNLGLGSLLYQARGQFPLAWKLWSSDNTNLTSVFDALKRYPYRPFSKNSYESRIDPRTYIWIKPFLDSAKKAGQDVALVPTWVQNIVELRTVYYKGVIMPFNVNNVDATVAANTIFGITSSILSGLVSPSILDDPIIQQVYHNTSALIAHELMNNMTDRPDLALTYYPSRIEFYWFVARSFSALETAKAKRPLPRPVMESVYQLFKTSLETGMTKYILAHAKPSSAGSVYFDDFLGDGDLTLDNKTLIRGEDRIFTTAMAVDAMLYTWTTFNDSLGISHWRKGATEEIQQTVFGAVEWLQANMLGLDFDPWNAFFSGSVKGFSALPFWYPGNKLEYLNGTVVKNATHIPKDPYVYSMEGYMDPAKYQTELKELHFGMPTPLVFNGYNSESGYFPLWSSEPYTYSTALVAITRFDSIRG